MYTNHFRINDLFSFKKVIDIFGFIEIDKLEIHDNNYYDNYYSLSLDIDYENHMYLYDQEKIEQLNEILFVASIENSKYKSGKGISPYIQYKGNWLEHWLRILIMHDIIGKDQKITMFTELDAGELTVIDIEKIQYITLSSIARNLEYVDKVNRI